MEAAPRELKRHRQQQTSALLTLAAIPLFLIVIAMVMYDMIVPIYGGLNGYDYESAYNYVLNGVGLIQGYVPGHIDHPGTPLQLLCGLIAYASWFLARLVGQTSLAFNPAVVKDLEGYIRLISFLLLGMNALAIFYLGLRIWRAAGSLPIALLAQTGFLFLGFMMPRLVYLSSEAIVIFAATMAMASLADVLFSETKSKRVGTQQSVAIAFFIALGVTTKVTFLPLVLLLAVLPTTRAKLTGLLATVSFAALFLLPIFSQLPRVFNWFVAIGSHTGSYGGGNAGFLDFTALPERITYFQQQSPMLFLAAYACLAAAGLRLVGPDEGRPKGVRLQSVKIATLLFTILAAQLLLAVKHFGLHYILPALSISSAVLAWSLNDVLQTQFSERSRTIVATAITIFLVLISVHQIGGSFRQLDGARRERDIALTLLKRTLDAHPNAIVIGCYRVRERGFGLQFAAGYLDQAFAHQLVNYMPQPISYNRWNDRLFRSGEGWLPIAHINILIAQGREVLMVLPPDIELPSLQGDVLLQIPGAERIVEVVQVKAEDGSTRIP